MRDPLFCVPIKYKLPLTIALVYVVAFGIGGFLVTSSTDEVLTREIREGLQSEALSMSDIVGRQFELAGRRVEDFASDGYIRSEVAALESEDPGRAAAARTNLPRHLEANKLPLVDAFVGAVLLVAAITLLRRRGSR